MYSLYTGPESIFLVQKLYLAIKCYAISSILDADKIQAISTILIDKKKAPIFQWFT